LALLPTLKHFMFLFEIQTLTLKLSAIATTNSPTAKIIPTLEITTIHTGNEPFIHVEIFFDIQELEKVGLKLNETLLFCGARSFFNEPQTIYPKLIKTFWRNVEFVNKKMITSKVMQVKLVLSSDTIAKAIGCLHEGSTYQEGREKNYDSHVTKVLYQENAKKVGDQKTIGYNLMCEKAKIWANILNKRVLHKAGSKTPSIKPP